MAEINDNKRLMKNTLFMYFRMIIVMGISLYTSRVVLNELGISDFGAYNVIGGLVIVFSFINSAMTSSTSRFLSFAIGQKDQSTIRSVFANTLYIHIGLAVAVLFLAETVGQWYVLKVMQLPDLGTRTIEIVYQCSIINILLLIVCVPFSSLTVSFEHMNVYAYLAITDVCAKLGIAFSLGLFTGIKLEMFAILQTAFSLLTLSVYIWYCFRQGWIDTVKPRIDRAKVSAMMRFSGWTLYSSVGTIASTQGMNLTLNYIFGVVINAAYGISAQIQRAISSFCLNFQIAINPQIIKTYSSGDFSRHYMLIRRSAVISFFLILIITLPILLNLSDILDLWLSKYPAQAIPFTKWIILTTFITVIANPFGVSVEATGRIGGLSLICTTLTICSLPIALLITHVTRIPQSVFILLFLINIANLFVKIHFCNKHTGMSWKIVWLRILLPAFSVGATAFLVCFIINGLMPGKSTVLFSRMAIEMAISVAIIYFIGLNRSDRDMVVSFIKNKIRK